MRIAGPGQLRFTGRRWRACFFVLETHPVKICAPNPCPARATVAATSSSSSSIALRGSKPQLQLDEKGPVGSGASGPEGRARADIEPASHLKRDVDHLQFWDKSHGLEAPRMDECSQGSEKTGWGVRCLSGRSKGQSVHVEEEESQGQGNIQRKSSYTVGSGGLHESGNTPDGERESVISMPRNGPHPSQCQVPSVCGICGRGSPRDGLSAQHPNHYGHHRHQVLSSAPISLNTGSYLQKRRSRVNARNAKAARHG